MTLNARSLRRVAFLAILQFLPLNGCADIGESPQVGTLQRALADGGTDGGADMGGATPRIKVISHVVDGATVAGSFGGYYDTKLKVKCKPERTTEGKIRCIPDTPEWPNLPGRPDFGSVEPPGYYFNDGTCTTSISRASKSIPASKIVGRYAVLKKKIGASEAVENVYVVTSVFVVTGKAASGPFLNYFLGELSTPGLIVCRTYYDPMPTDYRTNYDWYESSSVALTEFAEMTETW